MINMEKKTKNYLIILIVILIILGLLFLNTVTVIEWTVGILVIYGIVKEVYEYHKK